jgi:uncharacterized glyoxalase superfamily protein PhnB
MPMSQPAQRAVPMLSYEDVAGAVEWLRAAFGFREAGERFANEDGTVTHAELDLDGARVMLGWPGPHYRGPLRHAAECASARQWLENPYVVDGVLVHVDDLDAHYRRASAAGATILRGPEDVGFARLYTAGDLEGHRWMFMQTAS